jgi:hypothetical protein
MQIGDLLIYDSRRHVVRGFDPEGVSPRMIYLEDVATGAHAAVPFEHLGSHAKRGRLRLLGRPSSKERRNDLL